MERSEVLHLEPATMVDVPDLAALVNSAYRGDSSRAGWTTEADLLGGQRVDVERLAELVAKSGNVVLVLRGDGAPAACVHLERHDRDCYLGMLTVEPTAQGGGIGSRLLEAAERWAKDNWRVETVHMTVIVQRIELIAWYERRGYQRTGERRPFPYGDTRFGLPRRDDLAFEVLRKHLAAVV